MGRQFHVDPPRSETTLEDDHPAIGTSFAVRNQAASAAMKKDLLGHGGQRGTAEEPLHPSIPPPEIIAEGRRQRGMHRHPHSLSLAAALPAHPEAVSREVDVADLHPEPLDPAEPLPQAEQRHQPQETIVPCDVDQGPDRLLRQPSDPLRRSTAGESYFVEHRVPREPSEVGEDRELPDVVAKPTAEPPAVLHAPFPGVGGPSRSAQEGSRPADDPSVPADGIREAPSLSLGRVPAPDDVVPADHGPRGWSGVKAARGPTGGERCGTGEFQTRAVPFQRRLRKETTPRGQWLERVHRCPEFPEREHPDCVRTLDLPHRRRIHGLASSSTAAEMCSGDHTEGDPEGRQAFLDSLRGSNRLSFVPIGLEISEVVAADRPKTSLRLPDELIVALARDARDWATIRWGEGTKGPPEGRISRRKVRVCRGGQIAPGSRSPPGSLPQDGRKRSSVRLQKERDGLRTAPEAPAGKNQLIHRIARTSKASAGAGDAPK